MTDIEIIKEATEAYNQNLGTGAYTGDLLNIIKRQTTEINRLTSIIKNVQVYTEDKYFEEGNIYIKDGVFVEPFEEDDVVIDGEGCYAIPGLVDVHFHGCVGHDFCDGTPESIEKIAEYEASQGITTIFPATMTLSEEELMKIMTNAGEYKINGKMEIIETRI